jgi:hypothetical protein
MALREAQIVRYGRQILLRELGGRGQERLLASPVRVIGSGPAIDDAVAFLVAGGTPVELVGPPVQGFFAQVPLEPPTAPAIAELVLRGEEARASLKALVVVGRGVAFRTPEACDSCWKALLSSLEATPPAPAGALAALTAQRLALGWSEPLSLVRWTCARFETVTPPPCAHG